MSGASGKVRLIAVYRIVLRGGERFTVKQIRRELRDRYDIEADRKTIYSDLAVIDRFVPIRMVGSGKTARYERWDPMKL